MKYKRIQPKSWEEENGVEPMSAKHLPTIHLSLQDIPDAKDWEVGKEYTLELTVKMSSLQQSKGKKGSAEFEIVKIGTEDEEEDMDDEDEEEEDEDDTEKN